MRFDFALVAFSLLGSAAASAIGHEQESARDLSTFQDLGKRRGGGGGGGRGGFSSGGSSRGGSSSGSSGGSSSGSKSGSSSSANTKSTSNKGGTSSKGSGPQPSYVGGRYYGGGSSSAYSPGSRSPSGIVPIAFVGGAALAFWPGLWLYGAYAYPYNNHYYTRDHDDDDDGDEYYYTYYNITTDKNETRGVLCGCGTYDECSCDQNVDSDEYLDSLVGNGSYAALNKTIINVGEVNDTEVFLINGTLPNGTTTADEDSGAGGMRSLVEALGFWPAIAAVVAAVFMA